MPKKKKLNIKNDHFKKRLKENPTIEQKDFDNLLDKMVDPQSKSNGTANQ